MSGTQSTRWYFSDWMSDANVRACGLAARGLWMDMLCICAANKGKDHGYLRIAGKQVREGQLARLVGSTETEIKGLLAELELNAVFTRTRDGTIFNRRMVRAEKNRGNGRLGGNPNLLKTNKTQEPVQPEPKPLIPEPEPVPEDSEAKASAETAPTHAEQERQLFQRGRFVLGKNAGGMIASLLKSRQHDVALARSVIELAATKHDPRQWVAAAIRNYNPRNGGSQHGGSILDAIDRVFGPDEGPADQTLREGSIRSLPQGPVRGP